VVIPNRKIIGEILHNCGATRQLSLSIAVPNNADIDRVLATVNEVLAANPRVHKQPPPVVGVSSVGIGVINVAIMPWVSVPDFVPAGAEINKAVVEAFRQKNIPLPVPMQDIRFVNAPPRQQGGA
jgi:small conductance mechanosensitive channel